MSDQVSEVIGLLLGGGGDTLIAKMNPTQSDVATHQDRKKRAFTAGLSAVGATAGAAGLGLAAKETHHAYRAAKVGTPAKAAVAASAKPLRAAFKSKKLAGALIPLEVAGLGGEMMATKILHGDTKKKAGIQKDISEMPNQSSKPRSIPTTKGQLVMTVARSPKVRSKSIEYTRKTGGMLRKLPDKVKTHNDKVDKRDVDDIDVLWDGEFSKADGDKQQVFGWASVVELNGEPVIDRQGDVISADEMEKAGYTYVMKSRKGGDMHLRDNWAPIQKSEMIESFVVTPEKRTAMGLPDSVPTGWWVGFQVQDPDVWQKIKAGERTGFSIHGTGRRTS